MMQARRSFFQLSLLWWIILYCAQRNFSPFPIALHPDNLLHFCFYFSDQLCFTLFKSIVCYTVFSWTWTVWYICRKWFSSVVFYHTSVALCSTAHSIAELIFLWQRLQSAPPIITCRALRRGCSAFASQALSTDQRLILSTHKILQASTSFERPNILKNTCLRPEILGYLDVHPNVLIFQDI